MHYEPFFVCFFPTVDRIFLFLLAATVAAVAKVATIATSAENEWTLIDVYCDNGGDYGLF